MVLITLIYFSKQKPVSKYQKIFTSNNIINKKEISSTLSDKRGYQLTKKIF